MYHISNNKYNNIRTMKGLRESGEDEELMILKRLKSIYKEKLENIELQIKEIEGKNETKIQ